MRGRMVRGRTAWGRPVPAAEDSPGRAGGNLGLSPAGPAAADKPSVTHPGVDPDPPDDDLPDKARLASFSDNVISIALTLLVLDVRLPPDLGTLTVAGVLWRLGPRLLAFALSFTLVGVYWVAHHLMLREFRQVPRSVLWLNNLFLLWITLIPASAALLGGYPGQPAAAALYGLNVAAAGASLLLLLHWTVRHHRRHALPLPAATVRMGYRRAATGVGVALAGVALAPVHPRLSYAVYCLTPLGYVLIQLRANPPAPQAGPGGGR